MKENRSSKRSAGLSLAIILLAAFNLFAAYKLLTASVIFLKLYKTFELSPAQIQSLAAVPLFTIVALLEIWRGKKRGIVLAGVMYIAAVLLDIYNIVAGVSLALLLFFCALSREHFSR
jgi:hypothetical protein